MAITTIDAEVLSRCFLAGAKALEAKKDYINELNVFPVPDGDTGTNMTATIMSAAREVSGLPAPDMKAVCKAMSSGSLRGARGNSGVILSQLFRGFTKVVKTEETLDVPKLADAFSNACDTAYKAVMKPKEGTILTVARAAADKALVLSADTEDIVTFAQEIVAAADETLKKTPEMLPVLKEAGVVDSGGQGLVCVLEGARDILEGKEIDLTIGDENHEAPKEEESKYTYQTAFRILPAAVFSENDEKDLRNYYGAIAGEIYISQTVDDIAVTLQTNDPGHVLTKALSFGSIASVTITNLKLDGKDGKAVQPVPVPVPVPAAAPAEKAPAAKQAPAKGKKEDAPAEPPKEVGFVAVSIGKGLNSIFSELGADYIIEGGQTMNPSTEDILNAVEKVNAKTVIVLPNNKNIILAANQARDISEDKEVIVLPTKTIPQGIAALINFIPEESAKDNAKHMLKDIETVKSGEITYAVRDTKINDREIHKGDYMGIGDEGIVAVNPDIQVAFLEMLRSMVNDDSSLCTVYYGKNVKKKDLTKLQATLTSTFPELEFEITEGDQPVYYYIVSVE